MQRGFSSYLCILFVCAFTVLYSQPSQAGKVYRVKGKKVYIKLSKKEVGTIFSGDKLKIYKGKKRKGTVRVTKVKGKKVYARIKKGKVKKGYRSRLSGKKKKKSSSSDDMSYADSGSVAEESGSSGLGRKDLLFGILGGFGMASQSVNQGNTTSDQTGSSIAVKGVVDYNLFDDIGVRANVGMEMFDVSGEGLDITVNPPVSGDIGTTITYLSIDFLLRYYALKGNSFGLFLNAGVGILSPLSSESTSLDVASISTTTMVIAGGGVYLPMGGMELFVGADYYYFPPSDDVTTSVISVKGGLLFDF